MVLTIADSVQKGAALSAALDEHPKLFGKLYASMVRVGEEAGQLPVVMADLANLMEHEDEVRGEVMAAVAYPVFVLGFGVITVAVLLTVVLPRLFSMLEEMLPVLPLPTLILLRTQQRAAQGLDCDFARTRGGSGGCCGSIVRTPKGAEAWDQVEIAPAGRGLGFSRGRAGRFARTLGTLVRAGVSLLPALKIVENTIGNRVLARADRAGRGGNARRRFAGGAVAQARHFSANRRADD